MGPQSSNNGLMNTALHIANCSVSVSLISPALLRHGLRYACLGPPPGARPPLQSQTLCASMPPLIRKRGRAPAIYLVSGGTSWNGRLIFLVGMRDTWKPHHQVPPHHPSHAVWS